MAQPVLESFRRNTRQRIKQVQTSLPVSALGATVNWQLDRVGLLNYLVLIVRATVNLSSSGALATLGPWNLIERIRVDMNLGNMNIVDIDGYHLYLINKMLNRGWAPDGGGDYTPNANVYSAPVANGNNTWILPLIIPISANPGSQFDSGLISLQAPEVQVNVSVRFASQGATFVTNYNSISNFTAELYSCYFEYPNPNAVMLPPGQVVRTVLYSQPVVATGSNLYTIDRQGRLLQLASTFIANGARSDGIDRAKLIANINDTVYDEPLSMIKFKSEMDYSSPSPTGFFPLDLWHATQDASAGDDRDIIDTEVLTTLQWGIDVSSVKTLGSGNNFFNTARRILVDFAQPGLGPSI